VNAERSICARGAGRGVNRGLKRRGGETNKRDKLPVFDQGRKSQ